MQHKWPISGGGRAPVLVWEALNYSMLGELQGQTGAMMVVLVTTCACLRHQTTPSTTGLAHNVTVNSLVQNTNHQLLEVTTTMPPVLCALLLVVWEFWWFLLGPAAQLAGPGSTMDTSCQLVNMLVTSVPHLCVSTKTQAQYQELRQTILALYSTMLKQTAIHMVYPALHTTTTRKSTVPCALNNYLKHFELHCVSILIDLVTSNIDVMCVL